MKKLDHELIQFLWGQGFVIVSTLDPEGAPYSSCKGILDIDPNGTIYLLDLYRGRTYANLGKKQSITITSVDEHKFKGYCVRGTAKISKTKKLRTEIIKSWEDRITSRITQRLIKNIRGEKGHPKHPEALLPKPEYMIVMTVEEIIDLNPQKRH